MVDIFEKKLMLLGEKKIKMVTLTVTTSPTNATCNLTYNGTTYTTKSIQVEKGSTVGYSIRASDYESSSGSWIITEDTVKNVTLNHLTSRVTLTFANQYNKNDKLTGTLTVGSETKSSSSSTIDIITIYTTTKRPSYSYTVTHPTLGSKNGTGTVKHDYSSTSIYVMLKSDGTWQVS